MFNYITLFVLLFIKSISFVLLVLPNQKVEKSVTIYSPFSFFYSRRALIIFFFKLRIAVSLTIYIKLLVAVRYILGVVFSFIKVTFKPFVIIIWYIVIVKSSISRIITIGCMFITLRNLTIVMKIRNIPLFSIEIIWFWFLSY